MVNFLTNGGPRGDFCSMELVGMVQLSGQMRMHGSDCASVVLYEHALCYLFLLVLLLV